MKKEQLIAIASILILFVGFAIIQLMKHSGCEVLEIISPLDVVIDINNNGVANEGEEIKILDGYQYLTKDDINQKQGEKYGLTPEEISAFAYLTEKYTNDVLTDKKVDLKKENGEYNIYLHKDNYKDIILKSGYIFKDYKPTDDYAFQKRLKQIRKSDFKIYNAKSNKYHNLTCKYGLMAHNYVLLAKSQLPKGAKPCKYCIGNKDRGKYKGKSKYHHKHKYPSLFTAPYVKAPPMVYSNGVVKVWLTDYTVKLKPDRYGKTAICNEIVKQINSAKSTIDIAIYGYDRVPKIENAIRKAIARGVVVRLVHDTDSKGQNIYDHTFEFSKLIGNSACDKAPNYLKNKTSYTNSIMHNKFYIFDKTTVITGSANLSFTDMSGYNTNPVIEIKSPKIASVYEKEFNQMYSNRFHFLKKKITGKENIPIGGSTYSVYFSPKDNIIPNVLVPLVNSAKSYIYIPTFLITDKQLSQALINAKNRGVNIKVIVDATNAKGGHSKHKLLRQHGIQVKTENYTGKLHSKSMIIDDKYTVIGSMNYSSSGNKKNDENLIVIKDSNITKFYKKFFLYLWARIDNFWLTHDASAESRYSIGSCSDGIDNDYDGLTDMADEGCKFKPKPHKYSKSKYSKKHYKNYKH